MLDTNRWSPSVKSAFPSWIDSKANNLLTSPAIIAEVAETLTGFIGRAPYRDDLVFLTSEVDGEADFIASGDKHLKTATHLPIIDTTARDRSSG